TSSTNRTLSLGTGGGAVSVGDFSSLSVSGVISGSSLTKLGGGTLTLRGPNTYFGRTTVAEGQLSVSTASASLGTGDVTVQGSIEGTSLVITSTVLNAINDNAALNLLGGGAPDDADQGYVNLGTGVNELVRALLFNGVPQANGLTYGSSTS